MIKPESNAPSPMKPWVRVTDNQLTKLEVKIDKLEKILNGGNASIDFSQNQSLTNTFSFTPLDNGGTITNAGAMNFTAPITSDSDISLSGSLIVGDPSRQDYDPLSGEAVGSIPNLKVVSGWKEINPVTEVEYYTSGQMDMTDTFLNLDTYGVIHGDGLQILLANDGNAERQNIEILGATGTGTDETFQIENNASNVAIYTAGKYVNITGVDPAGYNGVNLLITSVNTGVSPMTFTVSGTETGAWVAGGYVTINQANSIYEGKLSVQGPAPDYTGVTISQSGIFIGSNGGDSATADVTIDSTGLTAPSAFIDQAVINGTRLFISETPPTAVNDGDIWIDKTGIFTQGSSYALPTATSTTLGGIELFSDTQQSVAANAVSAIALRTYGAQLNSSGQLVINVPWTDTVYSLPKATAAALGGVELFDATVQTVAANAVTTTASRTYGAQLNSADQLVINVPWTDTVYTLPKATASALGGVELFDATVQTVAANTATTTAGRTYGAQLNTADQLVINVPWTDTVYSLPDATASVKGGVIVGSTLTVASGTIDLPTTGITATSYTNTNLTVDSYGRITAISNGSGGGPNFSGAGTSVTGVQSAAGVALPISSASASSGNSGAISVITGTVTSSASPTSGAVTIKSGDGASTGANSGAVTIQSGAGAGSIGNSGSVTIDAGPKSGSGTVGTISIGATNATSIYIGAVSATPSSARTLSIGGALGTNSTGAFQTAVSLNNWYAVSTGGTVTTNLGGGYSLSGGGTSGITIGSWNNNSGIQTIGIGTVNGTSTTTLNGITNLAGSLNLVAGTTARDPIKFTANTTTPTLAAGVVDFDGNAFFATPKVNNATAGKGLIPTQQIFIPNANTTIVTSSGATGTFSNDVMGGKAIYLAASTTYEVEAVLYVQHTWSATQTNNFTINLLYPTGSTALINGVGSYTTSTSVSSTANHFALNSTTAVVISASPTTGNWYRVVLKGIIKTSTTAGDFSPTFGYTSVSGSTTATNTVGANSYIKVNPIAGIGADVNIGGWA